MERGGGVSKAKMLASYVDAFNRGDTAAYGAFYAPDVTLRNGRGMVLSGPAEILAFYSALRASVARVMRIQAVIEGHDCIAASLASCFTALEDGVDFSGDMLAAGDRVEIESMALYELEGGKFRRINATTIKRNILRKGESE